MGFFINNWSASTGILSNKDPIFNYTCIPKQEWTGNIISKESEAIFREANQYNFVYSDCIDLDGIKGQSNASPESFFYNHQIDLINGQLKDPSYGLEFNSLLDIENSVIFAYFKEDLMIFDEALYDFNQDGNPDDLNGDKKIENIAVVKVLLVSTDKYLFELERVPNSEIPHNH